MIKEKIKQAIAILNEKKIDLWLTFVRETGTFADPAMDLVGGAEVVWQSAFLISASGESIAIMGTYDTENFKRQGNYQKIIGYDQDITPVLLTEIKRLDPVTIAVNYSPDNDLADGLTHGMYLLLDRIFAGTPYRNRLISAEPVLSALRGRKLPVEVTRIKESIRTSDEIFKQLLGFLKPGLTEKQVDEFVTSQFEAHKVKRAFPTIINHGAKSPVGHVGPSDAVLEKGDLFHIDFGVKKDGYCSDIQRMVYFLAPGEKKPPTNVQKAFDAVRKTITTAAEHLKPGAIGYKIDAVGRQTVTACGYPEYNHALGHQLGRAVHDGGTLLGPRWPRYGQATEGEVEAGNVFTLELGANVPGKGTVSLEEDVLVTERGCEFLTKPQAELICL